MGKKVRVSSDPSRDRAHQKGAQVLFVQPSYGEHGNVHSHYYRQWALFWQQSLDRFGKLSDLHKKVYEIAPEDSGFRALYAKEHEELMRQYFSVGTSWIMCVWLTFQHFSNEVLGHYFLHPDNPPESIDNYKIKNNLDLRQKLEFILKDILDRPQLIKDKGYDAVIGKIEQMRNAINHPDKDNTYNASENDWDKVPLAWLLSGQFKDRFKEVQGFADKLFSEWESKKKELERPGKINIAKRGIVSDRNPNVIRPDV